MRMSVSITISTTLLLLFSVSSVASSATECPADVSKSINKALDNKVFGTCSTGVRLVIHSLFDILVASERDFLLFCRSPRCIEPMETLLNSIPTDCLIRYHGSERNLSSDVSTVYSKCAEVVRAADQIAEEYLYMYFLD